MVGKCLMSKSLDPRSLKRKGLDGSWQPAAGSLRGTSPPLPLVCGISGLGGKICRNLGEICGESVPPSVRCVVLVVIHEITYVNNEYHIVPGVVKGKVGGRAVQAGRAPLALRAGLRQQGRDSFVRLLVPFSEQRAGPGMGLKWSMLDCHAHA